MSDADEKDEQEEPKDAVGKISSGTVFPDPPAHDDMDARIKDITDRADSAKKKHDSINVKSDLDPETTRGMGLGLVAAYTLIGLPLVGAGLGWLADRAAGTKVFILFGVIAGLVGGIAYAVTLSNRQ